MGSKWKKSSRCTWDKPQCVEVKIDEDRVEVRDSKEEGMPEHLRGQLRFDHAEWQAFIDGVKNGEFDLSGNTVGALAYGLTH